MRFVLIVVLLMSVLTIKAAPQTAKEPNPNTPRIADPVQFDEWGDISFCDEKARLDNAAIQLRHDPNFIIYLVIFAGKTACVGEARARGIRAKSYLVQKPGIRVQQVVWIDGGYEDTVRTDVWIWPPNMEPPPAFPALKRNQVKLETNCRIKCRACHR